MSVRITSSVPAQAGPSNGLTFPGLTLTAPNSPGSTVVVPISNVTGLQSSLDGKLSDTTAAIGSTITATGNDLNLLVGLAAYGLITADLEKLADITVTSTEVNFLTGVSSAVQTQLDGKLGNSGFTAAGEVFIGSGAGTSSVEDMGDVLDGTFGVGYEFNDLKSPTASLDINTQKLINVVDPTGAQDAATKNYVDTAVGGSGPFLELSGGTMTGTLDLNGEQITLDADGDSLLDLSTDDQVSITLGGGVEYIISATGISMESNSITNLADPSGAQDGATKNYVDTSAVLVSGGTMTGNLDLNGNSIVLDVDGDSSILSPTDDIIRFILSSANHFTLSTTALDMVSKPIQNVTDPTGAQDAATKNYVDTTTLRLVGGTMTGDLEMGGNFLENPLDPINDTQVGDRGYNDARYLVEANNLSDLVNVSTARTNLGLATVAATGDYDDLLNKPALVPSSLDNLDDVNVGDPPALSDDGRVLTWNNTAGEFDLQDAPVVSAFGRTGAIISVSGDYTASQVTFSATGDIVATTVQNAIEELDNEKLAIDGTISMTGDLNMGGQDITNGGDATFGNHQLGTTRYTSGSAGNSPSISISGSASDAAPSYSFNGATDTGMWFDTPDVVFSVGGTEELRIKTGEIDANSNRVSNVANPTSDQDAVTLDFLNNRFQTRVLGSATGVDLTSGLGSATSIYTVPVGKSHIITQIIVVSSSYTPGAGPVDPVVSIGLAGDYDEVVESTPLSWGNGGSADQAVYVFPNQGADTPNAGSVIYLQKDVLAGGTFSALTVDVYVLGIEL